MPGAIYIRCPKQQKYKGSRERGHRIRLFTIRLKFQNVKWERLPNHTSLESPSIHLLSVLLKEKQLWQEELAKMESVHQYKFQLYNLISKKNISVCPQFGWII